MIAKQAKKFHSHQHVEDVASSLIATCDDAALPSPSNAMRSKFSKHFKLAVQHRTRRRTSFGDICARFCGIRDHMCRVLRPKIPFSNIPFGTTGRVTTRLLGGINCHRSNPFIDNGSDDTNMLCVKHFS